MMSSDVIDADVIGCHLPKLPTLATYAKIDSKFIHEAVTEVDSKIGFYHSIGKVYNIRVIGQKQLN